MAAASESEPPSHGSLSTGSLSAGVTVPRAGPGTLAAPKPQASSTGTGNPSEYGESESQRRLRLTQAGRLFHRCLRRRRLLLLLSQYSLRFNAECQCHREPNYHTTLIELALSVSVAIRLCLGRV